MFMTSRFLLEDCQLLFGMFEHSSLCNSFEDHILLNENSDILIPISLKIVPKTLIKNNPALIQIMFMTSRFLLEDCQLLFGMFEHSSLCNSFEDHILLNENSDILIPISLKIVPKTLIKNNPALIQIMFMTSRFLLEDCQLLFGMFEHSSLCNSFEDQAPWMESMGAHNLHTSYSDLKAGQHG